LILGDIPLPLDRQGAIPLTYYGPAGTIPTWSFGDAGTADLAGRVVFLGASAVGFGDRHASPFDQSLPGVEAHATLAANLLEGRVLRRDGMAWAWDILLCLVLALAGFASATRERPLVALACAAATVAGASAVLQAAFLRGWWLDGASVLIALGLSLTVGAGLRLITHRQRAANLAQYQSPRMIEALATRASPAFDGRTQNAAVLFVDVAGFSAHSEARGPEGTAAFLRLFHNLVDQAAAQSGGMIEHFAGDGVMVIFGLPDPGPDDAAAALDFIDRLYATVRTAPDWPGLALRVGGHAGPVRAVLLGSASHRHVTVSGDVVNTASRLQELARSQDAAIALSAALIGSSASTRNWGARAGLRDVAAQPIRGRRNPLNVWVGQPP
jgi:adenylate cyclase